MTPNVCSAVVASALLIITLVGGTALAQKEGGILKMHNPDSPASMSIHEEITVYAEGPMMGVFNNLVMFDQHVSQNSIASVVPDLATGSSWSEDGTELTLHCVRASNGTTESALPPRTFNAPGSS